MKTIRKFVMVGIVVLLLVIGTVTAFATSQHETPAEAVAGLTGREVQSIIEERAETGKSYGAIANEAGVLDEFKPEMLEIKKDKLAARVDAGTITQEQADAILERIETNQANCDGTGAGHRRNGTDGGMGAKFGQGAGQGRGQGGHGKGNGLRNGSCLNP